jgi:predicted Zn-dependent protease
MPTTPKGISSRAGVLATLMLVVATAVSAAPGASPGSGPAPGSSDLPEIGTPVDSIWTTSDEYQIGSMVVRQLREAGAILEDPEIEEYIQGIGSQLAAHAQEGNRQFHFMVVKDASVNAFALPGGFVCVNAGLILATTSESELAGVLSHEISHITQRHIVRGLQQQSRASLLAAAGMLAAILAGAATGNSNVGIAGVMAGQNAAIQSQLNFSRENEIEADRVGITVMAGAGYDPYAMATFFETIQRRMGGSGENAKILEFLQTHPVSSARVAEAKSRAALYPIVRPVDTTGYRLARERLRVMTIPEDVNPRDAYANAVGPSDNPIISDYRYYGRALALLQANAPGEAVPILRDLVARHPQVIEYHSALGQALLAAGDIDGSRVVLQHARDLFPRNVPVTVRYAETLMRANEPALAHAVLLDLFNVVAPTHDQARLIALAASAAGEAAEANYYMAESHLMDGDLRLAIETLRQALATPGITPMQRSRFKARIDELKEYLPPRLLAALERGEPLPPETPADRR